MNDLSDGTHGVASTLSADDQAPAMMNDQPQHNQPHLHQHGPEIQAYGELRRLPIVLSLYARQESCQLLNQILADTFTLHAIYKKGHWMAQGHTFYQLHLLFDKHTDEQRDLIDTLGERVQLLGGVAIVDPRHVAERTTISRPPNGTEDVPAMISRLLDAHEQIIEQVRTAIDKTGRNGDAGTNDVLVSQLLRTHERQVWFLAEHLVPTPATE